MSELEKKIQRLRIELSTAEAIYELIQNGKLSGVKDE